ncbi:MAG: cation transporter [Clostridia bacterium]|nr:cation transporter [Clostridia bacterium]
MRKVYKLDDVCCANCAAKIEREVQALDGVKEANVSFIMQNMTIDADDDKFDEVLKKAVKIVKKIEPDCEISGL